ncbi:MAG TPA: response regulator [Nannocystaceae bacterium]|nr:response regulator [Nannocystaceae bacterium]
MHTFAVRFESRDDFLVEYTDRLRHGALVLPVAERFPAGTVIRLRVHLPDDGVLYLTGVAAAAPRGLASEQGQWVKLNPLSESDEQRLERCVDALLGPGDDPQSGEFDASELVDSGEDPLAVLLVDDSVSQRLELGEALRNRDVRVRVAENGLLALSHALKRMPDAILTDVEMPKMDGWGLLRAIRQRPAFVHVPVVFLTRLSDELTRLRGYRMGVDDYLPKSMPPDEILARVRGSIARRRQFPTTNVSQGLRGELEHVRLGSVLAFLESERRSGSLHVRRSGEVSTLHVHQGALAAVENLGRQAHPHDRIFELLTWSHGEFEFAAQEVDAGESTPLSYLLLEHARRSDESANAIDFAPSDRHGRNGTR